MNAAVYARVSTDLQAEHGYSIGTQIESCVKAALELGATNIKQYIDDGYSGAYLERPALESLRDDLHAKMYDLVVCYVPDRLARRLSHQLLLTEEIERSGAKLHFVSVEFKNTPEGRLFYQMNGAFAEYEREKIRERTARGQRGKLRSGKPILDSHVYGYDFDKENSCYTVNPFEAEVVRRIFRMYAVDRVGGAAVVAEILSSEHVPSPANRSYWYSGTVSRILRQQMYTGTYYSNRISSRKVSATKRAVTIRPRNEWIEMKCPRIIDDDLFEEAAYIAHSNTKFQSGRINENVYLLRGIAVCGKCGRPIRVKNNNRCSFYACWTSYRPGMDKSSICKARYMPTSIVDGVFWNLLEEVCSSPSTLAAYVAKSEGVKPVQKSNVSGKIKARLWKISAEKDAIMAWFSKSLITQEEATKKLSALKDESDRLNKKLDSFPSEQAQPPVPVEEICAAVASCPNDDESRRRVVQSVVESVSIERTDKTHKPPKYAFRLTIRFRHK